jgi:muramoyltetrapeptide carboxypeptidase
MNSRRNFISSLSLIGVSSFLLKGNTLQNIVNNNEKILPKALKKGSKVAITAPAGAVWEAKQINVFCDILKNFGFEIVLGNTLNLKYGYFAGTDEQRANELNSFFKDKSIDAIFCMKGGWGCARILDLINFDNIKQNPKILIGFSDITSLLIAVTHKTGLVTFHGPVGNSGWNEFTSNVFKNICVDGQAIIYPENPLSESKITIINHGEAAGELLGGNLTVLTSMIGSNYLPDFKNKILFLEEAKEEPYSIDRMLTQLKLAGVFDKVNAILFGKCNKCIAEEPDKAFTTEQVFEQHFSNLKIPVLTNLMIGHIENKLTLPIGALATIDTKLGILKLNNRVVNIN